ncbi:hypothetical protein ACTID9_01200 [Brevibacillus fluminis]|uniref:hypothetical protein n=1 Tax=Brevibacillus fluminis TaxID=511487 RepID=UPI003F8BD0C0
MARVETIKFRDFMDGTWREKRKNAGLGRMTLGGAVAAPIAIMPTGYTNTAVVTATATNLVAGTTLQILAHALDPVTQILVAISLPVASIVIIGGCFFFMFGQPERAWSTISNAGLGYVLIQLSPLFIKVLEQVGKSF